jgi:hypothetical protein
MDHPRYATDYDELHAAFAKASEDRGEINQSSVRRGRNVDRFRTSSS